MKSLFITEKPSVAREFANALDLKPSGRDGYLESEKAVITWCVGHLVTMSYPDKYDPKLKRWDLETLPFLPEDYKYEIIPGVKKQYDIVCSLLNREDIDTIYVHRLGTGRRIYLPAGGPGSPCDRKTEKESLDRFPDERRGAQRGPGGQRPERV